MFENYYELDKELLNNKFSIFSTITGKYILENLTRDTAESLLKVLNCKGDV